MGRIQTRDKSKKLVALLTNHCDDVYCFRKELLEGIVKAGYQILISCPDGDKFALIDQELEYLYDEPVIDRRGTSPVNDWRLLQHYRRLIRTYQPDILLCYTVKPNVYGGLAAWAAGVPYINNVTGLGSIINKGAVMQRFILGLYGLAFRRAACVMFQNEENMRFARQRKLVRGHHRRICGSGVNTSHFSAQPYPVGGNGLDGEDVVFCYVGRILKEKGIDDYLEAAAYIKGKYPKTQFHILGFIEPTETFYHEKIAALEKDGVVRYFGNQKDVRPYIGNAHALIQPSVYGEGISNVLLESASVGRVLFTTDNPGCRDTVDDGVTGYIFGKRDVKTLCAQLEAFLALPNEQRAQMGAAGRQKMIDQFSREYVVQAYLEEMAAILQKG